MTEEKIECLELESKLAQLTPVKKGYLVVKRILDFLGAILLIVPAIIIILIFGILVKLESKGPMFYKQERLGLMGMPITVVKIRSMRNDAESTSGQVWAKKNDDRITKVGHFMRLTRIDELPQIFNVLNGTLSFIGPRPERPKLTGKFAHEVNGFEKRLTVKPGLSGLAQIRKGYEATPAEKLADDLEYINKLSFQTDFNVFFETISVVVTGRGAR